MADEKTTDLAPITAATIGANEADIRIGVSNTGDATSYQLSLPELKKTSGPFGDTLKLGGTSSAEVMLKRSGTELQVKLADDSAWGNASVDEITFYNGIWEAGRIAPGDNTSVQIQDNNGTGLLKVNAGHCYIGSDMCFGFAQGTEATGPLDARLYCDGLGHLAQRDGLNEQRFYLYNTYTSESVYERAYIGWEGNTCRWKFDQQGASNRSFQILNKNTVVFQASDSIVICGAGNSTNCLYASSSQKHCNLRSAGASYIFIDSDNSSTTDEFAVMANTYIFTTADYLFRMDETRAQFDLPLIMADGNDIRFETTTGSKLGSANDQKFGFWGATPVAQQVLPTGSTTDDVITLLQTLGLCRQA